MSFLDLEGLKPLVLMSFLDPEGLRPLVLMSFLDPEGLRLSKDLISKPSIRRGESNAKSSKPSRSLETSKV